MYLVLVLLQYKHGAAGYKVPCTSTMYDVSGTAATARVCAHLCTIYKYIVHST